MRSLLVEEILKKHSNIEWDYVPELKLASIDRKRSHKNQARVSQPLAPATVYQYKTAMLNGAEFPALVVFPDSASKFVVADGNHRLEAAIESGRKTHDAYLVVTDDPATKLLITFELNSTVNGLTPTDSDRDLQAVFLVQQGLARSAVAAHLSMSINRIDELMRENTATQRVESLGFSKIWNKVPRTSRSHLARIKLDPVLESATHCAADWGLSIQEVRDLVKAVLAAPSEADQLSKVAQYNQHLKAHKALLESQEKERLNTNRPKRPAGPMENPVFRFKTHLKFLSNDKNLDAAIVAGLDEEGRKNIAALILEAQAGLNRALALATS